MHLSEVRGRFDGQDFAAWNFMTHAWDAASFKGLLALADPKISLMNKGTRRRMLYTSPGSEPTSAVIQCVPTTEQFMVGNQNKDIRFGVYYRNVVSLHYALSSVLIDRYLPAGPSDNPGWMTLQSTQQTFGDYELRSDNENIEMQINQWGFYDLTFPAGQDVQRHDIVTMDGRTFYLFDSAPSSGFVVAKATDRPDARVNIVYTSLGASSYDPVELAPVIAKTSYNVTAFVEPYDQQLDGDTSIVKDRIRLMILKGWIGVRPKLNDQFTLDGLTYIVTRIAENQLGDEWHMIGEV